ncbi:MAG: TonB-dependent receptor plug domain-containing protein [Gammaproteobacteria bacterium]
MGIGIVNAQAVKKYFMRAPLTSSCRPRAFVGGVVLIAATGSGIASGAPPEQEPELSDHVLPEITVTARPLEALTGQSMEQARESLHRVPGGTSLIDAEQFRDGVTSNLQDVLSLSPGVYVQSRFGGSETRTSIRGSGISHTFNTRGVRFLLNGLPFSAADGNVRPQLVEPLAMRYLEVYRGANALPYGAAYLGGAVNFVAPTGYSAPTALAHLEYGSYDYIRPQLHCRRARGRLGWLRVAFRHPARGVSSPSRGRDLPLLWQRRLPVYGKF